MAKKVNAGLASDLSGGGVLIESKTQSRFITNEKDHRGNLEDNQKRSKTWLVGVVFILILLASLVGLFSWLNYEFAQGSGGIAIGTLFSQLKNGYKLDIFGQSKTINILIAGLDEIAYQHENSKLTDTLIMVVIHKNGEVKLVSIPRDLWIESLKTKINALYYYGEKNNDTTGKALLSSVIEDVTSVKLNYVLVLKLTQVEQLIDLLGGMQVDVERSFTDSQFPREGVDISSKDPAVLYETVTFNNGMQMMDGKTATKFMRSRHSTDTIEGTDEGRRERQKKVIIALFNKLKSPSVYRNPRLWGQLYSYYLTVVDKDWPFSELIATITHLSTLKINTASVQIPDSVLKIEKENVFGQWVYVPVDPTWQGTKLWFEQNLK